MTDRRTAALERLIADESYRQSWRDQWLVEWRQRKLAESRMERARWNKAWAETVAQARRTAAQKRERG